MRGTLGLQDAGGDVPGEDDLRGAVTLARPGEPVEKTVPSQCRLAVGNE